MTIVFMLLALGTALALFAGIMSMRNRGGGTRPGRRCPDCQGRGWFRTNYGKRKCYHCKGEGTLP